MSNIFEENSSIAKYLSEIDKHLDDLYTLALYRLENLDYSGVYPTKGFLP